MLKITKTKILIVFIMLVAIFTLSSCGSKYGQKTLYLEENSSSSGCFGGGNGTSKYDWLIEKINKDVDATADLEEQIVTYKKNVEELISNYARYNAIANSNKEDVVNKDWRVSLIKQDIEKYNALVNNITSADVTSVDDIKVALNGSAGCFDTKSEKVALNALKEAESQTDVYRIAALFVIQVDDRITELEPIVFKAENAGDFFAHLWNNLFIFPVAWVLYFISKLCGGYYIIGLIITTLLIRTLGWPIYAKTNDISMKMNLVQGDVQKIQEKYAGKNDPESQRMMQMEQAQLYKKNGIGVGGCLAPFLQFPIFMAIFRAISRIPYTTQIENSIYKLNWASELNPNFAGINLFEDRNGGGVNQLVGIIILILVVVGTQVLSQLLSQKKQKKAREKEQEDIPAYRRQAVNQTQNSTQSSMKLMLWMMIFMMGMFVWTSKAGLGIYWCIGNLYSMAQMVINNKTSEKRMEKLRNKQNTFTVNQNKKK